MSVTDVLREEIRRDTRRPCEIERATAVCPQTIIRFANGGGVRGVAIDAFAREYGYELTKTPEE